MRLLRRITPKSIITVFSTWRQHERQKITDLELNRIHESIDLHRIAEHCVLLPTRIELLKRLPTNGICAEVGVAQGDFSQLILRYSSPAKLHLIDLWACEKKAVKGKIGSSSDYEAIVELFRTERNCGKVELHRGCSWEELQKFPNNYFDWIYIDAGHSFESVSKDLHAAEAKVKQTGFVAGHDYTRWGCKGLSRFGVIEAVNQFCNNRNWRIAYLTNEPDRHLSYALCKM